MPAEMSLAQRVVLVNSAVLLIASLALALGPATVSAPIHADQLLVLLAAVVATMAATSCSSGARSRRCSA